MGIGERIKLARKWSRMSQEALSQQVQVSKMAISKYERNLDTPSSSVLLHLSSALNVPVEFFFRPPFIEINLKTFRKHATLKVKDQLAIEAQVQEWLERYLEIEGLMEDNKGVPLLPNYPVKDIEDIEEAALKLRKEWNLGSDAIENLMELLEDKGIKVGLVENFEKFDACTFVFDGDKIIVTRKGLEGDRQRFNLAHELGHLVLLISGDINEEKSANRFAGAFLVPAITARRELGEKRTNLDVSELYLLKHKYGLSMQAWIYRARDLAIIDQTTFNQLFRQFSVQGWRKNEPGKPIQHETPRRIDRLIYRAISEEYISRSRAEELLGAKLDKAWG
ncbi:MAG: hypothetical protein CL609_00720 [Anaerolineaceae bacterium]|nr:hypothetical protein [Anaerolineaceae bacterium]